MQTVADVGEALLAGALYSGRGSLQLPLFTARCLHIEFIDLRSLRKWVGTTFVHVPFLGPSPPASQAMTDEADAEHVPYIVSCLLLLVSR